MPDNSNDSPAGYLRKAEWCAAQAQAANRGERPQVHAMRLLPEELTLAYVERSHILTVLDALHGNRSSAAKILNISVRCLRNKLREYRALGIQVPEHDSACGQNSQDLYREIARLLRTWSNPSLLRN